MDSRALSILSKPRVRGAEMLRNPLIPSMPHCASARRDPASVRRVGGQAIGAEPVELDGSARAESRSWIIWAARA
jgi:hypothetical protein